MATTTITLLLADDHALVRHGLCVELEQQGDLHVIAEADSVCQAVRQTKQQRPRVALVDAQLPDTSGIDACRQIIACCPTTAVLILSTSDEDVLLARADACGATGFLCKTVELDELVSAIHQAAAGQRVFTPVQQQRIRQWRREVEEPLQTLTRREREVLRFIVDGATNREIAGELHITVKTAEQHVSQVLTKFQFPSRREVIAWANRTKALIP